MKHRKYFLLTAAALLVFAVFAAGGCGGSSSYPGTTTTTTISELDLPSMFDIRTTPEFAAMIERLKAEGVWAKVDAHTFYNVLEYLTDEELQALLQEVPEEDRSRFISQNKMLRDELVSYYENGGILTLFHPNKYAIEHTLAFLRSVSADISMIDINTDIEICAITKQTIDGVTVSTDNTLQLDNIFVYVVPDISSLVSADFASSDISPDDVEKEYLDVQVSRWERYCRWLAGVHERAAKNAAAAAAIESSAAQDNSLVRISRVLTGTYDWSYVSLKDWDKIEMSPDNTPMNTYQGKPYPDYPNHMAYYGSRNNMLDYQVYSAHSFTDHSDYFLISSSMYTKPMKVEEAKAYPPIRQGVYTLSFPYLRGYTTGSNISISIKQGQKNIGECVKTSMPDGVSAGTKFQEAFTWSNDGVFAGHDFGEFAGVSFSGNISFDAANITVKNSSETSSADFTTEFDKPAETSSTSSGLAANNASVTANRLPSFSVWKVSEESWKAGYSSVALVFKGYVKEGAALRNYYFDGDQNPYYDPRTVTIHHEWPLIEGAFYKNFEVRIGNPNPPMHSTVHQRYYACNRHGTVAGVHIHSEGDWQIILESSANHWITFEKTSGKATGPEGEWVTFTVSENTSGIGRHANIMLVAKPYNDSGKIEATVFEMFQSSNEGIRDN